jgi:competence protein ComEC
VHRSKKGDTWTLGNGRIEVLHPPLNSPETLDENNGSLVLRAQFDTVSILFPGDIEAKGEAQLAQTDCTADILKVPHHGSKTSSTANFLKNVNPRLAVVSTGGGFGKEPVDDEVMARYRDRGTAVMRTDFEGAVRVTTDRGTITVEGERDARVYPRPRLDLAESAPGQ